MPAQQVILADTPEALSHALEVLDELDTVGIDVERADWDRYWRAAALVQVGGDGRVALVDPVCLDDLTELARFVKQRRCILHAMDNDLGPLAALGVELARVEDTGLAAAVLGLPLGLETLLGDLLGVELRGDKAAMQRANWEARPLTAEMQAYAADDVADLPALWESVQQRLVEAGREDWYRQDVEAVRAQPSTEQRRDWTRTKGLGRLDPAGRTRLRALWDAREELARSSDTAPSRIAADRLLLDFATTPPASIGELGRRGLRRHSARSFGPALMAAIASTAGVGAEPLRRTTRVPSDADRAMSEELRVLRSRRAKELSIDAGVLCPSRVLMGAVLTDPTTPTQLRDVLGLRPWQWAQLGDTFCQALGLAGEGRPPPLTADEEYLDD